MLRKILFRATLIVLSLGGLVFVAPTFVGTASAHCELPVGNPKREKTCPPPTAVPPSTTTTATTVPPTTTTTTTPPTPPVVVVTPPTPAPKVVVPSHFTG